MKKYIICILLFAMLLPTAAMAEEFMFQVEVTEGEQPKPPMQELGYDCYLLEIDGEPYFIRDYTHYMKIPFKPIPYKQQEFDFFVPRDECEYIWTGEYYYARRTQYDEWPERSRLPYSFPIKLYDANFQLVKEYQMPYYSKEIDYVDGVYYCYCDYSHYYKSTDFETWEAAELPLPRKSSNITFLGNRYIANEYLGTKISFNEGGSYYPVLYENVITGRTEYLCKYGNWIIYQRGGLPVAFYITLDNVYFMKIAIPSDIRIGSKVWSCGNLRCIYENNGDLVFDCYTGKLKISKQIVSDYFTQSNNSTDVNVNNTILGFETPPVTESDRTLVPMRFLFEQLGADVTWDEATETATAKKANTTINFSIDNTTATVNGAATTMDVPARLVGDKSVVPLRVLSEEMGYTVEWDEETRMATITTPLTSRVTKTETNMFDTWIR